MATGGWKNVTQADITRQQLKQALAPKRSKHRNIKVRIGAESFDSKHEAEQWLLLQARERAGEIIELRRQVPYPLYCPAMPDLSNSGRHRFSPGGPIHIEVSRYIADYQYRDVATGRLHVVDAKPNKEQRTALYVLKRKWLELQSGIVIEEVFKS